MLTGLAKQTGKGMALLDELWSSDVTELRAASLIESVQAEIAAEYAEQERKKANRRGRRGR
jgi:hypothetical protein